MTARTRPQSVYLRVARRRAREQNETVACACGCGETFLRWDRLGRERRYVMGHNPPRRDRQYEFRRVFADGEPKNWELIVAITGQTRHGAKLMARKLTRDGVLVKVRHGWWKASDAELARLRG